MTHPLVNENTAKTRPPKKERRAALVEQTREAVLSDRYTADGSQDDCLHVIVDMWTTYLKARRLIRHGLTTKDVCAMMALMKLARISQNPYHDDSWSDLSGYGIVGGAE